MRAGALALVFLAEVVNSFAPLAQCSPTNSPTAIASLVVAARRLARESRTDVPPVMGLRTVAATLALASSIAVGDASAATPTPTQKQAEAFAYTISSGKPLKESEKALKSVITDDICFTIKESELDKGMTDTAAEGDTIICGKENYVSVDDDYADDTSTVVSPITVKGDTISFIECDKGKDVPEGGLKIANEFTVVKVGSVFKAKKGVGTILGSCDVT
mmetsp:Transcript_62591/g.104177  ORF Transcript_62591/g.104177 Transcript_62591/m.104177 type:complete len:218 (+) Transcript_62591:30-683(+)